LFVLLNHLKAFTLLCDVGNTSMQAHLGLLVKRQAFLDHLQILTLQQSAKEAAHPP
jgi:hypothetical protein